MLAEPLDGRKQLSGDLIGVDGDDGADRRARARRDRACRSPRSAIGQAADDRQADQGDRAALARRAPTSNRNRRRRRTGLTMATEAAPAPRRRFRQQGRADRDRRRRRAREADRPDDRHRGDGGRDPARRPRPLRRRERHPRQARSDLAATCACGASSRWSRRSTIISSRSASRTRRSCSRARCSATIIVDPLPPIEFGRIAAQAAKQVIFQKVRDAERERQYEEFKDRAGEIITGVVKRVEFGHVVVDLGRAEGVIRRDQQIPREVLRVGDRIRSLILNVRRENRGPADLPQPRPSRLHEEAVRAGSARDLRRHHRDQGRRPRSGQPRQDRRDQPRQLDRSGRRLRRHEGQPRPGGRPGAAGREDRHHPLVARTSPPSSSTRCSRRRSRRVVIDEEESRIEVVVPDDQLSLAIGRRGQNVRLASQLTGSAIDIMTEADASEKRQREFVERSELFQNELDVDETLAQLLVAEGFGALEEVAYVELDELALDRGLRRRARRRAAEPRRRGARSAARRPPARSAARWASRTRSPKCPISPRRCW